VQAKHVSGQELQVWELPFW